jgi:hypothetical protein
MTVPVRLWPPAARRSKPKQAVPLQTRSAFVRHWPARGFATLARLPRLAGPFAPHLLAKDSPHTSPKRDSFLHQAAQVPIWGVTFQRRQDQLGLEPAPYPVVGSHPRRQATEAPPQFVKLPYCRSIAVRPCNNRWLKAG